MNVAIVLKTNYMEMKKVSEFQVIMLHIKEALEANTTHFLICKTRPINVLDIIVDNIIPDAREMYYVWPKQGQTIQQLKDSLKQQRYMIVAEHEISATMTSDELFDLVVN